MARILVIEDDDSTRDLIEEALRATGHKVFLAENGKQGLKMHRAEAVDLIITDIYMPEMEGLEFIRTLREERNTVPIIAMSGNPDLAIALKVAAKLGAAKVMSKPFRPRDLRLAVDSVLAGGAHILDADEE